MPRAAELKELLLLLQQLQAPGGAPAGAGPAAQQEPCAPAAAASGAEPAAGAAPSATPAAQQSGDDPAQAVLRKTPAACGPKFAAVVAAVSKVRDLSWQEQWWARRQPELESHLAVARAPDAEEREKCAPGSCCPDWCLAAACVV